MPTLLGDPIRLSRHTWDADNVIVQDNVANSLSPFLTFIVPRGQALYCDPQAKPNFCIVTAEDITPGGTGSQVLATTYPISRFLSASDAQIADGILQHVALKTDGTKRTISAVQDHVDNRAAGSITISDASAAAHRVCYPPFYSAQIVIRVKAPGGAGTLARNILSRNLMQLETGNQDRDGLPITWGVALTENFIIECLINAPFVVATATGATSGSVDLPFSDVEIPARIVPMRYLTTPRDKSPQEYARAVAQQYVTIQ